MSTEDNEENKIIRLDDFRQKKEQADGTDAPPGTGIDDSPTEDNTTQSNEGNNRPHVIFRNVMKAPSITEDDLPAQMRNLLQDLNTHFAVKSQNNPKESYYGIYSVHIPVCMASLHKTAIDQIHDSYVAALREENPASHYKITRRTEKEMEKQGKAGAKPEQNAQHGSLKSGFMEAAVGETRAYNYLVGLFKKVIPDAAFRPRLQEIAPDIYAPVVQMSVPVRKDRDLRKAVQDYLTQQNDPHPTKPSGSGPHLRLV